MESYHERPYLIVSIENGLVFLLVVRCLKNTGNDSVLHRSLCLPYNTWEVTGAWEIVVPQTEWIATSELLSYQHYQLPCCRPPLSRKARHGWMSQSVLSICMPGWLRSFGNIIIPVSDAGNPYSPTIVRVSASLSNHFDVSSSVGLLWFFSINILKFRPSLKPVIQVCKCILSKQICFVFLEEYWTSWIISLNLSSLPSR